ncbi:MAG: type II secretion system F family protein [bacterium]
MIIYIGVMVAVSLFFISGALFLFGSRGEEVSPVFRRFKEYTGYGEEKEEVDFDEELLEGTFYERNIYPVIERVGRLLGGDEETKREKLEKQLQQAGRPGDLGPNEFLALQIVLGLLSMSVVILGALIIGPTSRRGIGLSIAFAAISGVASYVIPKFYLAKLVTKRQKEVRLSLPYAIDLLVVSAEAGLGFEMALKRVVDKMSGTLAEEFHRVTEEVKLGTPRKKALANMVKRVEVDELQSFVSAVNQAEELGASISEVLRIQADQMRTKRRQQIEEQAQKAPVKMLLPMVLFIFPTIFIVILGPVGLEIYRQATGDVAGGIAG